MIILYSLEIVPYLGAEPLMCCLTATERAYVCLLYYQIRKRDLFLIFFKMLFCQHFVHAFGCLYDVCMYVYL